MKPPVLSRAFPMFPELFFCYTNFSQKNLLQSRVKMIVSQQIPGGIKVLFGPFSFKEAIFPKQLVWVSGKNSRPTANPRRN
jgi:hypothetical protein